MSGSVNKVIIIGNLGADPDVRTTPSGQMVASLSIATSETFNNREGQRQERTEWHRVQLWGKQAELAQRYLSKGRKVYIEGRIQTRSWDDEKSGQKRYSTEIVASNVTFLDSDKGRGSEGGSGEAAPSYGGRTQGGQRSAAAPAAGGAPPPTGGEDPGYFDDDVPF